MPRQQADKLKQIELALIAQALEFTRAAEQTLRLPKEWPLAHGWLGRVGMRLTDAAELVSKAHADYVQMLDRLDKGKEGES
jgi:hypothetical protein